jgi:hypothetical protein
MEKDNIMNIIKNQNPFKEEIFLDYLNCNNSPVTKEEFVKPTLETFDKFFNNDVSSPKSLISMNKSLPQTPISDHFSFNNINNFNNFTSKLKGINFSANQGKNVEQNNSKNNDSNLNIYTISEEDNCSKDKNLFNTIQNEKIIIEDLKKKKLMMNRESAKKSRLKKKKYVENLEKEFIILKEELIRLKSCQNINDNGKCNKDLNNNSNDKEEINNGNQIYDFKKEQFNIISNNLEKNPDVVINYANKQKKLLQNLLVKQIDIMTPIKIKAFQNKFLKLQTFNEDDSIEAIKNKIKINLNTIIELYDINDEDNNNKSINICNKKNSMAYHIYNYYNNLKEYVNQYDFIYNKL